MKKMLAEPTLKIKNTLIDLQQGDLTHQNTDAIVNATNYGLSNGGGVSAAIHRAAGEKELQQALEKYGICYPGDAVITPGFNLRARYIIHAVGPFYYPDRDEPPRLLASAYRRSLEVAAQHGIKTIAFPAISTGVFRYPLQEAAEIAIETVCTFAEKDDTLDIIRFVLYSEPAYLMFKLVLG